MTPLRPLAHPGRDQPPARAPVRTATPARLSSPTRPAHLPGTGTHTPGVVADGAGDFGGGCGHRLDPPKLAHLPAGPYVGLGVWYAVLRVWFVLLGAHRQRAAYLTRLVVATGWVLFWGPG